MTRKPDRYNSFSALREHEIEGFGYRIHLEDRSSHVAVIAPHGGFIEPATSEIALAIADEGTHFIVSKGSMRRGFIMSCTSPPKNSMNR